MNRLDQWGWDFYEVDPLISVLFELGWSGAKIDSPERR